MNAESVEMAPSNGSNTTPRADCVCVGKTGALYDLAEPNCDGGTRVHWWFFNGLLRQPFHADGANTLSPTGRRPPYSKCQAPERRF